MGDSGALIGQVAVGRVKAALRPEAIEDEATAELERSPCAALRQASCEYRAGVLTLRGRVPTFYCKQVAQSLLVRSLAGTAIDNQLAVDCPG
jgi:hypothetical protein